MYQLEGRISNQIFGVIWFKKASDDNAWWSFKIMWSSHVTSFWITRLAVYLVSFIIFFSLSLGAWICLNNISTIQPPVLSVLTQLVTVVLDGLKASKSTVVLHNDEITLVPQGACFGTLNYSADQHKTEYDPSVGFFPSFKSSATFLPVDLWEKFRPVELVGPDLQVIIQVWLLSQGFTQVSSLASKIVTLRNLCLQLLPSSSKPLPADLCLCLQKCVGWGAYALKRMIEDAGSHLGTSSEEVHVLATNKGPFNEGEDVSERAESPTEAVDAVNVPLEALRHDGKLCHNWICQCSNCRLLFPT